MILTAIKEGLVKRGLKIKLYRNYKSYKPDSLVHIIVANVPPRLPHELDYSSFEEPITSILEKHIAIKKSMSEPMTELS